METNNVGVGWPFFLLSAIIWGLAEGVAIRVAESGGVGVGVKILVGLFVVISAGIYTWGLFLSPGNLGLIAMVWDTVAFVAGVLGYNAQNLAKVFNFTNPQVVLGWGAVLAGGVLLVVGWEVLDNLK